MDDNAARAEDRQRGLQVVLATPKPVAYVHRKDLVERSSSVSIFINKNGKLRKREDCNISFRF